MKNLTITFSLLFMTFSSVAARAEENASLRKSPDFYRLAPASVKEVVPTAAELYSDFLNPLEVKPLPVFQSLDWGTLTLIGEKVIQIIQAGKPVVNVRRESVAVVPQGVTAWTQLETWKMPVTKVYSVQVENYFGVNVVDLRLKVSAMHGGSLDGRGKFLANVQVVPTSVYVLWGFSCDVWTEHQDPVNLGSKDSPVAGLGFDIRYRYSSLLMEEMGANDYFVSGAGEIKEVQ